ncbi:MAG: hypothetical protein JXC32_01485 [Anaerolineae bacterium]|nr:hypothetical protein [Anaerolineae bacterium]
MGRFPQENAGLRDPLRSGTVRWGLRLLTLGLMVTVLGCEPATPAVRIVTPTPQPTIPTATATVPTATPTATPTVPPTATPTATPEPTMDPAHLRASAETGLAAIQAQAGGARIVCIRYEDTDADGQPEWLALTHRAGSEATRLDGFVLDGDAVYELTPALHKPGTPDVGLGEYATCELVVRDVNYDGTPDIGVFGHAEGNETMLHLFTWEDSGYRRLGFWSGDAGVKFMDADGDLEEEIWEGYRVAGAPNIAWYVIYTWEQNTYGWTSDAYDWYFDSRPQSYPTQRADTAVMAFYLALNDRDLPGAYDLLVSADRPPYETWAAGYATTLKVSAGGVHTIPAASGESQARVAAMVRAWDNEGGVILGRLWNVEWDMVLTENGWRLVSSTAEQLDEWPVDYVP